MRLIDIPKELFKIPWLEERLASLTYKRSVGDWRARLAPLYNNYKKNSIRHVTRNEIQYELDISDYMEWLVYFGIEAEPRDALYQLVNRNDTIFDVGANIGEVTFNISRLTGRLGSVHSFEPEPFIFSKLFKNLSLNQFDNVYLNNVGLGDADADLFISSPTEGNRGGTRIGTNSETAKMIKVTTMDSYVEKANIKEINLIKIDVEGFELKVLRGANQSLRKFKPTLFIEVDNENLKQQGDTASALINFLCENGYSQIIHAEREESVTPSDDFRNCHFDIIVK